VVILNVEEAYVLADIIRGKLGREAFFSLFAHTCSAGFDRTSISSTLVW